MGQYNTYKTTKQKHLENYQKDYGRLSSHRSSSRQGAHSKRAEEDSYGQKQREGVTNKVKTLKVNMSPATKSLQKSTSQLKVREEEA